MVKQESWYLFSSQFPCVSLGRISNESGNFGSVGNYISFRYCKWHYKSITNGTDGCISYLSFRHYVVVEGKWIF